MVALYAKESIVNKLIVTICETQEKPQRINLKPDEYSLLTLECSGRDCLVDTGFDQSDNTFYFMGVPIARTG